MGTWTAVAAKAETWSMQTHRVQLKWSQGNSSGGSSRRVTACVKRPVLDLTAEEARADPLKTMKNRKQQQLGKKQ